jgi:DNA adenine methylase
MRYIGSKARIVSDILPIILKDRKEGQLYVEPFAGSFTVVSKVTGNRLASDFNSYLIAMFKAVRDGWIPPESLSKEDYYKIRAHKEMFPDYLVGFVGFGCSFGARWFTTYAETEKGREDFCAGACHSLVHMAPLLKSIDIRCSSFEQLDIPDNSIIYCDPPYAGTPVYCGAGDWFGVSSSVFWDWVREKYRHGCQVFVSEYQAPPDFKCVWQKEIYQTLNMKSKMDRKRIERLFVLDK